MLILTSSNNYVTKDFVKYLPKKPQEMRLTFVDTAGEVEKGDKNWLHEDRQALVDVGFQISDFTFTNKSADEVRAMLNKTDFIFISGGNTFFLLQEMKKSGFADVIKSYVDKGMIYGGSSAGSIVAGPDIGLTVELDDQSYAPELENYTALGLTDVVTFPHWGSPHFHKRYEKAMKTGYRKGLKIILLTDDQYLLVKKDGSYTINSI